MLLRKVEHQQRWLTIKYKGEVKSGSALESSPVLFDTATPHLELVSEQITIYE